MTLELEPGKYVVAVSGGVDSIVLLDMLAGRQDVELIIAHFDHGMRSDSGQDREFVQELAGKYGLPCVYEDGHLGPKASEAEGREARYKFFHKVRKEYGAKAIITAHHQDDVLETAILNLIRGTSRKGLTALGSHDEVIRPMLQLSKRDILIYAQKHKLNWHEDSTNADERYLRNYIRHRLLTQFDDTARQKLLAIIQQSRQVNQALDQELMDILHLQSSADHLDRQRFISLPHAVAKELLASWLRANQVEAFDRKTLERVTISAKTKHPGAKIDIVGNVSLAVEKDVLALIRPER